MKSWIRYILCACLIMGLTTISEPVHASQTEALRAGIIQPYFTYINVFQNTFEMSSNGKASVTVYLTASGVEQAKVIAYLQQFKNGKWSTIKSWSSTRTGTSCGLGVSWYVLSGYSYRLVSHGYTWKNGIIVETSSYVSGIKKY